jgi:hypothetical protein
VFLKQFKGPIESVPHGAEHRFQLTQKAAPYVGSLLCLVLWIPVVERCVKELSLHAFVGPCGVKEAKRSRKRIVIYLTMGPTNGSSKCRKIYRFLNLTHLIPSHLIPRCSPRSDPYTTSGRLNSRARPTTERTTWSELTLR